MAVARSQAELLQQQLGQVLEIKLVAVTQSVYTAVKAATDGLASSRWDGDGVGIILGC